MNGRWPVIKCKTFVPNGKYQWNRENVIPCKQLARQKPVKHGNVNYDWFPNRAPVEPGLYPRVLNSVTEIQRTTITKSNSNTITIVYTIVYSIDWIG